MNKTVFNFLKCFFITIMICASVINNSRLFALADEKITVNGQPVSCGDTVTYEYYIGGIDSPVEAVGAYIDYDASSLEYVDNSIGFDVLQGAMIKEQTGSIYYCAINIYSGFDFNEEGLAFRASFKVLDGAEGELKITNRFDEFFTLDNESVDLTPNQYKVRESLLINAVDEQSFSSLVSPINANDVTESGIQSNEEQSSQEETASAGDSNVSKRTVSGIAVDDRENVKPFPYKALGIFLIVIGVIIVISNRKRK